MVILHNNLKLCRVATHSHQEQILRDFRSQNITFVPQPLPTDILVITPSKHQSQIQ